MKNKHYREELINWLCKKLININAKPIYKLVSGRQSRFYANCKPVILSGRGARLVGTVVYKLIKDTEAIAVGGLTFGADPISVATAIIADFNSYSISAFSIRKKPKGHGTEQWIEGDVKAGDRVVIIDDVATTGGSTIKAIRRAKKHGLEVIRVVILVDRQEGGLENIRKHVKDIVAIFTKIELIEIYKKINK